MGFEEVTSKLLPQNDEKCNNAERTNSFEDAEEWSTLKKSKRSNLWPIAFHVLIFLCYTVVFVYGWIQIRHNCNWSSPAIYSPADEAVKYEARVFHKINGSDFGDYVGEPRPELDAAWERLLKYSNIRISESEMANFPGRAEDRSVHLTDGGYFSIINVYHNLHCVKRLHHYMYEDYYFPNLTAKQKRMNRYHSHHCLDMLRQSLMCQADTQVITMKWGHAQAIPIGNFTSPHQCVNWENIDKWAKDRWIDVFQPGLLSHPEFGYPYEDMDSVRLGEVQDH